MKTLPCDFFVNERGHLVLTAKFPPPFKGKKKSVRSDRARTPLSQKVYDPVVLNGSQLEIVRLRIGVSTLVTDDERTSPNKLSQAVQHAEIYRNGNREGRLTINLGE